MRKGSNATKLTKNNRFDVLNESSKPQKNRNNQRRNHNNSKTKYIKTTKKTNIKKTNIIPFSNNMEAFPSLSGTDKNNNNKTNEKHNSYANETKPIVSVSSKKKEVEPGWVNINFVDNKINYTRNTQYKNKKPDDEQKITNGLDDEQHCKLENMVLRWETHRNKENEMYGESSLFWHEKSLLDPLSDDCYSDTEESYESSIEANDEEYDDLYDDI